MAIIYREAKNKQQCDLMNKESNNIICLIFGHNWNNKYREPIYCKKCKKAYAFF